MFLRRRGETSAGPLIIRVILFSILLLRPCFFEGEARLRLSFTDPRNESDILSAPGDFTTVDEAGNAQPLKSFGMIRMSFENDKQQKLSLTNNVKVYIDAEKVPNIDSNAEEPRLWWLDEKTGRWRDAGPIRPVDDADPRRGRRTTGRKFLVGEIETDNIAVVNFDIPWKRCYVRVEASVNMSNGQEPAGGVEVRMIGQDGEQFYGFSKAFTMPNGIACLPVWCNASGFIQAEKYETEILEDSIGKTRIPLVPNVTSVLQLPPELRVSLQHGREISSVHFTAVTADGDGPIFNNEQFKKCSEDNNGVRSFRFSFQNQERKNIITGDKSIRYPPGHRLAWYSDNENTKCFLRVDMRLQSGLAPDIMLESFTPDAQERFGFTTANTNFKLRGMVEPDFGPVCMEYRCSETGKPTTLRLNIIADSCYLFVLSDELYEAQVKRTRESELQFEFSATEGKFGEAYGLYTGSGDEAEKLCYADYSPGPISEEQPEEGPVPAGSAVRVMEGWECPPDSDYELLE